eukprot:m.125081 g.125081  ORF g.125081 m.125081 type:complete len:170 (-) comp16644_c1_seq6:165-674(-)
MPAQKKKTKRQLQAEKAQAKLKATQEGRYILAAREDTEPLRDSPKESTFSPADGTESFSLSCTRVDKTEADDVRWAYQLVKTNMIEFYRQSEMGWADKRKQQEMKEAGTFYLIARCQKEPVAFASFQFDFEDDFAVRLPPRCNPTHTRKIQVPQDLGQLRNSKQNRGKQ